MWSYVMAATRGDTRRLCCPESVFTVQQSSYDPNPGPVCRGILHCKPNSESLNFNKNQLQHPFLLRKRDGTPSRNTSEDTLAEVAVENSVKAPFGEQTEDSPSSSQSRLFSAVRGRLRRAAASLQAAVRFRRFSRKDSHPPDWFVDKSHQEENAEKDANCHEPATCWGHKIIVDPSSPYHYKWLMVVSLAVLYNVIFVLGRAVFWELNNSVPVLWWTLDYACDAIYILDIFVHAHEANDSQEFDDSTENIYSSTSLGGGLCGQKRK
ncbi:hypothetical protein HHI36_019465 [Cryptolaemus montrouzieri]|uniref:Uncharacterized protein n=1 Tax=Cryptolaemus montrouzieri TaxID=559131 RepID=A0ABD2P3R2_9CUCU